MKREKHKDRLVSRKLKKALKNYPCKKTKLGRYIIDVLDSHYDNGGIGIGYYDGMEIFSHDEGYEHPLGYFFHHLIYDENHLWSCDYEIAEMLDKKYNNICDSDDDLFKPLNFCPF